MTDALVDRGAGPDTFVGRDAELGLLIGALEQARSGRGGLVLIGGEPGIGKSRLADEFSQHARSLGARVLPGRCWEGAGAPAYWPWIQVMRAHLRSTDAQRVRRQLGTGAADIAQILPEIHNLVPDLAPEVVDSESARFQLFDSTTSLLRNLAQEQETVVVLEDLHAADTPSILLLRFVASQLSDMRLLILGTYRDIALTHDHPLTGALGELAREPSSRRLTLTGLREDHVRRFIAATAGIQPALRTARDLWRETSGNPLFLGEAVRLLQSERHLEETLAGERPHLAVPTGVREVIARRIAQLQPPVVKALTIGAAVGPEFPTETLRQVGQYTVAEAMALLDEAVRAGLLAPVTGTRSRFRFSHDLVREYLYQEQATAERVHLHRQIATVLEDMPSTDRASSAELAHHYFEAARGDEEPERSATAQKAQTYATRAGEHALKSLAYEEASRLFRMARSMLDLRASNDDEARMELLLAAGEADARAGELEGGNADFLEAAAIARRTDATRHLARAALGLGGRLPWARPGHNRDLIPLLEEALMLLGSEDERLRVALLGRLACAWRSSPDKRDQSDALSRQALDIARRLGDPATLCDALLTRFWATWWPENPRDRGLLAREVLDVAEAAKDNERIMGARLMLWCSHTELGDMRAAAHELEHLRRSAEELRQPAQLWLGVFPASLVALLEGDFATAHRLIELGGEREQPAGPARDDVSAGALQWFLLMRELGRPADAEGRTRDAATEIPWYPAHRAALALLLLDDGRRDEAKSVHASLAEDRFAALYRDNEWLLGMSLASEASWLLGDAETAAVLYEQLEPFAGRHAIGHGEGSVGSVDRYLGLLCAALGRLDDAVRHLADAVRHNREMGARPWVAHSQHDYASVLRARRQAGDEGRAKALIAEALATARDLGMVALERRLEALSAATDQAIEQAGTAIDSAVIASGTIRREGEYWTISYGGDSFRLRDAKGLHYIARLLAQPGREMLALELAQAGRATATSRAISEADLRPASSADAGAQLDQEAKQAYRARLHELQAELDEAESWNDPERAERARNEMEFVARELASAVGLGGRDRPAGSASERARLSVTRAIRLAMGRIAAHSTALGEHLETTIHTGTYCAYTPDARVPVEWST